MTYYQARRLSGHTSPCGEFSCFLNTFPFQKSKVGTLQQKRNLFWLRAPCIIRTTCFFDVDQLSFELGKHQCNYLGDFHANRRFQASLVEEAQDGVFHYNTWSSGTSYGGINPYNLMARLGPGDLAHHEIVQGLIQLLGVSCKETRRGDQVGF